MSKVADAIVRENFTILTGKRLTTMLATVTGTYKNGQIILDEDLPVKTDSAKVIVTLVEETVGEDEKPKRTPGLMKGTFVGDYWFSKEFNDPLDDLEDYM